MRSTGVGVFRLVASRVGARRISCAGRAARVRCSPTNSEDVLGGSEWIDSCWAAVGSTVATAGGRLRRTDGSRCRGRRRGRRASRGTGGTLDDAIDPLAGTVSGTHRAIDEIANYTRALLGAQTQAERGAARARLDSARDQLDAELASLRRGLSDACSRASGATPWPDRVYAACAGAWIAEGGGLEALGATGDDAAARWARLLDAHVARHGPFPIEVTMTFRRGRKPRHVVVAYTVGRHAWWNDRPGLAHRIQAAIQPDTTLELLAARFAGATITPGRHPHASASASAIVGRVG
jgi:hypothetical protein